MKVSTNAWKNWPVFGTFLGFVALVALGLSYWMGIQDRERYLQGRNFRLLADLAGQTANLIETRARIVRDTITDDRVRSAEANWRERALGLIRGPNAEADLAQVELLEPAPSGRPPTAAEVAGHRLAVQGEGSAIRLTWVPPTSRSARLSARIPAAAALARVFRPRLSLGAFDTLALASPDGHVVYAVGRRAMELQTMSMAAMLPAVQAPGQVDLAGMAERIAEARVTIAGVSYRLFSQPCCGSDAYAAATGPQPRLGFLIAGLVEVDAMQSASWAVSPVLILGGIAFVLTAVVSWPFLKCALAGPQQRVTRRDVVALGAAGLYGLALITILLLSAAAYSRLSAEVDGQLTRLADRLHDGFSAELGQAARQSAAMRDAVLSNGCVKPKAAEHGGGPASNPCAAVMALWSAGMGLPDVVDGYNKYTAFALLDPSGFQRVKTSTTESARRQLNVSDRDYFQRARTPDGLWRAQECPEGCYLESSWSWTSGKPQVVLSRPTGVDALPVAALSLPMGSVIDPILPPGFEFAIVDRDGKVHFHSDTQRNVHENLLLETDGNRRLQSLITAHGAGRFNTSYWGRPYRAYVRPTTVPDWSIVTLHDKSQTRPLVLEWTAGAMALQLLYLLVWVAGMLGVWWRGGGWLWPDPRRRPWYGVMAVLCLITIAGWGELAARLPTLQMAGIAAALPLIVWVAAYALMAVRPEGGSQVRAWTELSREYQCAGALMLVVTAVLPAASFFALSQDLHMEAFVKQRQIALARAVGRPPTCPALAEQAVGILPHGVRYDEAATTEPLKCVSATEGHKHDGGVHGVLHGKIEEWLPYYTAAAISLRELMHSQSDDGAWTSDWLGPRKLEVSVQARQPQQRVTTATFLPSMTDVRSQNGQGPLVWATLLALVALPCVSLAAFGLVYFFWYRVLMADVFEPAREADTLPTEVGTHGLVICDDPDAFASGLAHSFVLRLLAVVQARDENAAWRRARESVRDAAPVKRTVIPDIDAGASDAGVFRRLLARVEELVADPEQTVILVTRLDRATLQGYAAAAGQWERDQARWTSLLDRFKEHDLRGKSKDARASAESPLAIWWSDLQNAFSCLKATIGRVLASKAQDGSASPGTDGGSPPAPEGRDWRAQLLADEGRCHRHLEEICRALSNTPAFRDGSLTRDQILEEIEERAMPFYQRIWRGCDEDARVVLEHVAHHGLATAASRRVVRRLLARELIRKDPELRLMNESFSRFVLEAERRLEVATLERQAGPSVWDRLRIPIATAALISLAFLLATQREAFDATVAMAAGVTTAVPTLLKLTTLLTQWGARSAEPKAHA